MRRAETDGRRFSLPAIFISVFFFGIRYAAGHDTSVHEILSKYGFPVGLLPDSVVKYNLGDDGIFSVEFDKPCYIEFEYLVYYNQAITGRLSYGSITELKGIQVKQLFFWLDVDEIKVDLPPSDYIYFQIGIICKRLDSAQFRQLRSCRSENALCRIYHRDPLLQLATTADNELVLITE